MYVNAPQLDHSTTSTQILSFRRLIIARFAWSVIFVWGIVAIVISFPITYYHELEAMQANAALAASGTRMLSASFVVNYSTIFQVVAFVALTIIAGIIVFNRSNNWMALWLSLALLFLTPITTGQFTGAVLEHPELGLFLGPAWFTGTMLGVFAVLLFPNGRITPSWLRWLLVPYVMWEVGRTVSFFILGNVNAAVSFVSILPAIIMAFTGIGTQVYRYRRSGSTARHQIKWFAYGVATMITAFAAAVTMRDALLLVADIDREIFSILFGDPLTAFGNTALAVCLGVAITRYRLYDIDLVINRSLVGGLVTALLVVVFIAVTYVLKSLLRAENDLLAFGVSALVSAMLFQPARRRVRYYIDRKFYGLAFDLNELREAARKEAITSPGLFSGRTFGNYKLLDVIGRGGMGEIYKANCDGTTTAIKVLTDNGTDPNARTRFEREARAGQSLNHPNIARIMDSGEVDGVPYMVMEYVEGRNLSSIIEDTGSLDEETTSYVMRDVGAALDEVHRRGFVHRDLKPSNIMIRSNGQAVLMDFGVTKFNDATIALTGTEAVGTIAYMAPEQIVASRDVGPGADIYAMGVMCFEMLTGKQPFSGGVGQVLFAHIQQPAPDPRSIKSDIREGMAAAVLRSLAKTPEERFVSAGEFAKALMAA